MNQIGTRVLRFIVMPILVVAAYYAIIGLAVQIGYSLYDDNYMAHEGFIYFIEGIIGLVLISCWILFKKRFVFSTPKFGVGKQEDYVYAVIMTLAMLGIATLYFFLVERLEVQAVQDSLDDYHEMIEIAENSKIDIYLNLIASCIFIPILEELLFRGLVMNGMLECANPVISIIMSGVFFGLMHLQAIQVGYAILAGIMLGTIYYLTSNILMSILSHMLFNFLGVGIYMLFNVSDHTSYILMIIEFASIAIAAVLTVFMAFKHKDRFPKEEKTGDINKMLPGRHT